MATPEITSPEEPGARLISLFSQLYIAERDVAEAGTVLRASSVIDTVRNLRKVRQLRPANGDIIQVFAALDKHESAEEAHNAAQEKRERVREELLEHSSALIGEPISVTTLPSEEAQAGVRWEFASLSGSSREKELAHATGIINSKPPSFVLEGRLELTPVDSFMRRVIGGTYHITPIDPRTDMPRVALGVEA